MASAQWRGPVFGCLLFLLLCFQCSQGKLPWIPLANISPECAGFMNVLCCGYFRNVRDSHALKKTRFSYVFYPWTSKRCFKFFLKNSSPSVTATLGSETQFKVRLVTLFEKKKKKIGTALICISNKLFWRSAYLKPSKATVKDVKILLLGYKKFGMTCFPPSLIGALSSKWVLWQNAVS